MIFPPPIKPCAEMGHGKHIEEWVYGANSAADRVSSSPFLQGFNTEAAFPSLPMSNIGSEARLAAINNGSIDRAFTVQTPGVGTDRAGSDVAPGTEHAAFIATPAVDREGHTPPASFVLHGRAWTAPNTGGSQAGAPGGLRRWASSGGDHQRCPFARGAGRQAAAADFVDLDAASDVSLASAPVGVASAATATVVIAATAVAAAAVAVSAVAQFAAAVPVLVVLYWYCSCCCWCCFRCSFCCCCSCCSRHECGRRASSRACTASGLRIRNSLGSAR